ncbi:MAG: TIGR02147 family protein [Chitinivibrionales bacterium]|nr:TIGR02147 family protein [Chitinivibrionales bacterium]MBD3396862.1 TIGR02147 family protein [Chitinivibrionales bacterium]
MQSQESIVCVFDYTDYRRFLADYYACRKKSDRAFSYRYFAKRLGISSSGLYKEVIDGKRGLSRTLIVKFSQALKLNKREAEYFENMVYFCEAKTVDERKLYFKKMMASYDSRAYKLLASQYEYFSRWYYVAVREHIDCHRFNGDYAELARSLTPPIRTDQARKAIRVLEKLNLVRRREDGVFEKVDAVVTTGYPDDHENVDLVNIINFQKTMMDMAQQAYDRHSFTNIDMSTLTLSVSRETYEAMKEDIADFRKKLLAMAQKDKQPDRVYELNYQFFPLTRTEGERT